MCFFWVNFLWNKIWQSKFWFVKIQNIKILNFINKTLQKKFSIQKSYSVRSWIWIFAVKNLNLQNFAFLQPNNSFWKIWIWIFWNQKLFSHNFLSKNFHVCHNFVTLYSSTNILTHTLTNNNPKTQKETPYSFSNPQSKFGLLYQKYSLKWLHKSHTQSNIWSSSARHGNFVLLT